MNFQGACLSLLHRSIRSSVEGLRKKREATFSSEVQSSHHDVFQALDLEFMRRLCTKVNIIPVIGEDFDRKLNLKSLIEEILPTNIYRKSRHVDKNRAGLF